MTSLILRVASRFLLLITLVFSVWALFRGHNLPGGGFIGGLLAASGFALYLFAFGANRLKKLLRINLNLLLALGLLISLVSGLLGTLYGKVFFTAVWAESSYLPSSLGTPILFDIGVYLVVLSSVLIIMIALEESE
tara:strand:+ start:244 stop:651 length:408 start_codon:yes stop_codon:yes gene_type:complete